MQRFAGDMAGAKITAEQARNTLESATEINKTTPSLRQPCLELCLELIGVQRDSSLKAAEHAIMLLPRAKDRAPDLPSKRTSRLFRRSSARKAVRSQFSPSCYKCRIMAGFTAQRLLRRPFLGSIRCGILCAPIPLSKKSARKSSRELLRMFAT